MDGRVGWCLELFQSVFRYWMVPVDELLWETDEGSTMLLVVLDFLTVFVISHLTLCYPKGFGYNCCHFSLVNYS